MSKFTIRHGGTVETSTPAEVAAIIAAAMDKRESMDYFRHRGAFILGAGGAGQDTIDVPAQFMWVMERVALGGTGAVNALINIYENQQQATDMLETIQVGASGLYSDSFSNCIVVPPNSTVLIATANGVAGGEIQYNYQIRRIRAPQ